jgi:hypothetical protein
MPPPVRPERFKPAEIPEKEARPYIIKGLIGQGDHAIIMGQPGSGKSVLAPYLAYGVAQGFALFGRRVRPGPVIYIAAEDGHGMKARVRALFHRHGDAPDFYLFPAAFNLLRNGAGRRAIIQEIDDIKPVLIVIDTLARSFDGLRENDAEDMGRVVQAVRQLTATCNSAVLTIHHVAKDAGTTPRGHGSLNGDADITLLVEGSGGQSRTIRLGKNRNGTNDAQLAFAIETHVLGIDDDGDPITAPICAEVASAAAFADRSRKLADGPALLLRTLQAIPPSLVSPAFGLPIMPCVHRKLLRSVLVTEGWFPEDLVSDDGSLRKPAPSIENNALRTLKRRCIVGFNRAYAWLI